MKNFLCWLLLLALSVSAQTLVVESEGYGRNRPEAIQDALRNAVEQGAGVKIFSESLVREFVLWKDILISTSFGLVTSYEILETSHQPDALNWKARIQAHVSGDIDSKWAHIKVVLQQKGYPVVKFMIKETTEQGVSHYGENALIQEFKNLGIKTIRDPQEGKNGPQINPPDKAHLIVSGDWQCHFHGQEIGPGGLKYIVHTYNLQTQIYRPDTSQIIGAVSRSYRVNSEAFIHNRAGAARAGFAQIVKAEYTQALITDLLKIWVQDIQEGHDITLIITHIEYRQRRKITDLLNAFPELITAVTIDNYHDKKLTITLKSRLSIDSLVEKLEQLPQLTLIKLQPNQVQMQYQR